ncbi:MAG: N-methyl-L-tryptophan oxidase [Thermomicrobiales bacterium]
MTTRFEVIVVGLGVMGSATAHQLAARGQKVLGIDAFAPGHTKGSSHGESRIIRQAYHEAPDYVPLIQRAYHQWREVESEAGTQLLFVNGGLILGEPNGRTVQGTMRSGDLYGLPYEPLSAREVRERYPGVQLPNELMAVLEPNAGYLLASRGVKAFQDLAKQRGAKLRFAEPMVRWGVDKAGTWVETGNETYRADRLVLTAGPWTGDVLSGLGLPLTVQRVANAHFQSTRQDLFDGSRAPIFSMLMPEGHFYAIPGSKEIGFKIGRHDNLQTVSPDDEIRPVTDDEITMFQNVLAKYLPGAAGPVISTLTCLYTTTPDKHFVIDRHPEHEQVVIACGFSGHGYKFAPVVGEVLADLAIDGRTEQPIAFLRASRFPGAT